jgi:hypothetical protein
MGEEESGFFLSGGGLSWCGHPNLNRRKSGKYACYRLRAAVTNTNLELHVLAPRVVGISHQD